MHHIPPRQDTQSSTVRISNAPRPLSGTATPPLMLLPPQQTVRKHSAEERRPTPHLPTHVRAWRTTSARVTVGQLHTCCRLCSSSTAKQQQLLPHDLYAEPCAWDACVSGTLQTLCVRHSADTLCQALCRHSVSCTLQTLCVRHFADTLCQALCRHSVSGTLQTLCARHSADTLCQALCRHSVSGTLQTLCVRHSAVCQALCRHGCGGGVEI
jgi:hypothetical protein